MSSESMSTPCLVDTGLSLRARAAVWADRLSIFFLIVLAATLPIAGITGVRDLALFGGIFFVLLRMGLERDWRWIRTPLELPFALFLAVSLLSLTTAVDLEHSLDQIRGEAIKWILMFYFALHTLKNERRARLLFGTLILTVLIMDVYGLAEVLIARPYYTFSLHASTPQFWTWLVQTAPFVMLAIFWVRGSSARFRLAVLLWIHALCVYYTRGRMPVMALVIEAGLVLFLLGMSWKKLLLAAISIMLLLAVILPNKVMIVGERLEGYFHIGNVTIRGLQEPQGNRWDVWTEAINHLKEHPFAGTGFGRETLIKKYQYLPLLDNALWHTHNVFLTMAVGMGLQGLAVFLFMLYRLVKVLWPGRFQPPFRLGDDMKKPVLAATFVMLVGYIMVNLTNELFVDDHALLFWLLVGSALSLKLQDSSRIPQKVVNLAEETEISI